jgi:UDP-N-acetylglucosamine 2-epimerase (non-hydrolysing)
MDKKEKRVRILVSFGTRPEGIKLAPVIKVMEKQKDKFELIICSTGQHKEMLKQVIDFFELKPDFDLNIMSENQSLSYMTSMVIRGIENVFSKIRPDIVLVQGDTTTAFLTAFVAYYWKIKIGHVEAGLRTYNKYNPFPEEINRQFISRISDFNFAPTKKAEMNLLSEKVEDAKIFFTGNTIVDAINWGMSKIKDKNGNKDINNLLELTDGYEKLVLVTMHRRESFGKDIKDICSALKKIAEFNPNVVIVYPVHLNPNVQEPVFDILGSLKNIKLIDPLSYEPFLWLMSKSYFIITDSGGIQEEAPTLKKPVLVIRKYTERLESVKLGISKLVGTSTDSIVESAQILLHNKEEYNKMIIDKNPYGDGFAAEKIANIIYSNY